MQTKFLHAAVPIVCIVGLAACDTKSGTPPVPTPTPAAHSLYVAERNLNQVAVLQDTTGTQIATISVGKNPSKLAYDSATNTVWSANTGSGNITRIDAGSNTLAGSVGVGNAPVSLIDVGGKLYVADNGSNAISVVDPASENVTATVSLGAPPIALASTGKYLAVAESDQRVELVDYSTLQVAGNVSASGDITGIGGGYGDLFIVTSDGSGTRYHSLAGDGSLPYGKLTTRSVGSGVVTGEDSVWYVSSPASKKLTVLLAGTPTASVSVGSAPQYSGNSANTNYTYVPNSGDDTISVVDTVNATVVSTWKLAAGAAPYDVIAGTAVPSPSPSPTVNPTSTPASGSKLYVANGSGGDVLVYTSPYSAASAPSLDFKVGGNVWGVAVDSQYVAIEDSTGFIYVFNAPLTANSSPVAQFQAGSNGAQLAFDSSGNLYSGTLSNDVLEFSPPFANSMPPTKTISGANSAFALAFDYTNTLYAAGLGVNEIDAYAPPYSSAPVKLTSEATYGLASYATYLFGADAPSGAVVAYNVPLSSSSGPAFVIPATDPHALVLDGQGTLYVGDQHGGAGSGSIDVFAQPLGPSSTKAYSIVTGVVEPVQMAIGQ